MSLERRVVALERRSPCRRGHDCPACAGRTIQILDLEARQPEPPPDPPCPRCGRVGPGGPIRRIIAVAPAGRSERS